MFETNSPRSGFRNHEPLVHVVDAKVRCRFAVQEGAKILRLVCFSQQHYSAALGSNCESCGVRSQTIRFRWHDRAALIWKSSEQLFGVSISQLRCCERPAAQVQHTKQLRRTRIAENASRKKGTWPRRWAFDHLHKVGGPGGYLPSERHNRVGPRKYNPNTKHVEQCRLALHVFDRKKRHPSPWMVEHSSRESELAEVR